MSILSSKKRLYASVVLRGNIMPEELAWGMDTVSAPITELPKPLEDLTAAEIRELLVGFDRVLSGAEEETDRKQFVELGGGKYSREDKAKEAEALKVEISKPGGLYEKLATRLRGISDDPIDQRNAELRYARRVFQTLSKAQ